MQWGGILAQSTDTTTTANFATVFENNYVLVGGELSSSETGVAHRDSSVGYNFSVTGYTLHYSIRADYGKQYVAIGT